MMNIILECSELVYKGQIYGTCRAISLLADNDFGNTPAGIIITLVINLITIKKADQVSILFNGA